MKTSDSFGWQVFGVVMGLVALFSILFMAITTHQFKYHSNQQVVLLKEEVRALSAHSRAQDDTLASFVGLTDTIIGVQENQQTMLRIVARNGGLLPRSTASVVVQRK